MPYPSECSLVARTIRSGEVKGRVSMSKYDTGRGCVALCEPSLDGVGEISALRTTRWSAASRRVGGGRRGCLDVVVSGVCIR